MNRTRSAIAFLLSLAAVSAASLPARAQACRPGSDQRAICEDREIYLMPGAQGVVYAPAGGGTPFVGGGVQLAPFQWSHNNDRFGPGQGAVFFQVSLLRSPSSGSTMALWEGGTTLSFERNAGRRFAIPYFGATLGAATHPELPDVGYTYPIVGVHAVYDPHLMIDLQGGYVLPFQDLDTMRGPRGECALRFSMW
jgi:hypothetical protein